MIEAPVALLKATSMCQTSAPLARAVERVDLIIERGTIEYETVRRSRSLPAM